MHVPSIANLPLSSEFSSIFATCEMADTTTYCKWKMIAIITAHDVYHWKVACNTIQKKFFSEILEMKDGPSSTIFANHRKAKIGQRRKSDEDWRKFSEARFLIATRSILRFL